MKARFHRALLIEGKFFSLGVHEVPDKVFEHPHFQKYLSIDWITDPDSGVVLVQETLDERNKRLAEKLAGEAASSDLSVTPRPDGEEEGVSSVECSTKKVKPKKK